MSHELRTPLNAILGFSQLELMKGGDGDENTTRLNNIKLIKDSGEHLLTLINEVLDLSRVESGEISFSLEPIHVNSLLDEVYSQCKPLGLKYEVSLVFEANHNYNHLHIRVDRTRLKQVLINLLSNGIRYNKKGGVTQLSFGKLPGEKIRISVADQGKGLLENEVPPAFAPFDRLNMEWSGIEGTGIGLPIAKQLTEAMGGVIGVNSKVGEGSVFYVIFPLVAAPASSPSVENINYKKCSIEIPGSKKVKILYIEDNPANASLINHLFKEYDNIELHIAKESIGGFETLSSHSFDLIMLDINLPGMDGFEIFNALADDDRFKHIPVMALSANALQSNIDKALDMGFCSYVVKPIEIPKLVQEINKIFA